MSGYLARLVERAVGPPAEAVLPRLGPVFPLGPSGREDEPARVAVPPANAPALADAPAPRLPAEVAAMTAAASRRRAPGRLTPTGKEPPRARRGARAPSGEAATATRPLISPAAGAESDARSKVVARGDDLRTEVVVPAPAPSASSPPPRESHAASEGARDGPVRQAGAERSNRPATALVRPRVSHVELSPSTAAASPRELSPRIEVRIGRVEIRRPPTPEPVQWPNPAIVERPASGFGELAAARRYVDRQWS